MKSCYLAGLGLGLVAVASCSSSDGASVTCGAGTVLQGNECVASAGAGSNAGTGNTSGAGGHAGNASNGDEAGSAGTTPEDAGTGGEPGSSGGKGPSNAGNGGTGGGSSAGDGGTAGDGETAGNGPSNAGNSGTAGGGSDPTGLITAALECGSRDVTGATVLTEPITQDTTWSGVIHLPNGLSVRNEPTLTIAPGTKIIVGHNASIEFGYLGSHATIVAKGTIDKPIKFCGETDTAGYWTGLIFRSGLKSTSVLRNVLLADGGATDAALALEMPLLVQGVQVRHSGANGVNAVGFDPASALLIVSGAAKLPLKAVTPAAVQVPADSRLTGNGIDAVDIGFTSFDTDISFRNPGVPYRLLTDLKSVTTSAASVVSIEPGTVYWLAKQKTLDFGIATVRVAGSAAKPIVFQGLPCVQPYAQCSAGFWSDAVDVGGRVSASGGDLRFGYVELRKLGWSAGSGSSAVIYPSLAVSSSGTLKVDHLKILDAPVASFTFAGTGKFSPDSNNFSVRVLTSGASLSLGCSQVATIPADTTLTSPSVNLPYYTSINCPSLATPATTWSGGGSPYLLAGLSITSGASLTLQRGTILRLAGPLAIQSGGTLKALGTSSSTIQFGPSQTVSFTWPGIEALAGSSVQLDYVLVDNAQVGITARGPVLLTHSTISNNIVGVRKTAADTTDYLSGNTFSNNVSGNVGILP